jgi:hypothetical protein
MAKSKIQEMQEHYLLRAKQGDPDDVVKCLYRLVMTLEEEGASEQLSADWLGVLGSSGDTILNYCI